MPPNILSFGCDETEPDANRQRSRSIVAFQLGMIVTANEMKNLNVSKKLLQLKVQTKHDALIMPTFPSGVFIVIL